MINHVLTKQGKKITIGRKNIFGRCWGNHPLKKAILLRKPASIRELRGF